MSVWPSATARRRSVVRAPVEAEVSVEVADEMRGDGGAARVRERVRLPERRAAERHRLELLSDVDLERAERQPRRERILRDELDLPVDAVVREHPPSGAHVEVRRVRRAERREAPGRVEDRVGAGDPPRPNAPSPSTGTRTAPSVIAGSPFSSVRTIGVQPDPVGAALPKDVDAATSAPAIASAASRPGRTRPRGKSPPPSCGRDRSRLRRGGGPAGPGRRCSRCRDRP